MTQSMQGRSTPGRRLALLVSLVLLVASLGAAIPALAIAPPTTPAISLPAQANRIAGLAWRVSATSQAAGTRTLTWKWSDDHPACRFDTATRRDPLFWCSATTEGSVKVSVVATDSGGLSSKASKTFELVDPPSRRAMTLSLTTSPPVITSTSSTAKAVDVTIRITDKATGKPVIGMPVGLYRNGLPGGHTEDYTLTTSRLGVARFDDSIRSKIRYTALVLKTPVWPEKVQIKHLRWESTLTASFADATVEPPQVGTITGKLLPVEAQPDFRTVVVQVRDRATGSWTEVRSLLTSPTGAFSLELPEQEDGTDAFRVVKPESQFLRFNGTRTAPMSLTTTTVPKDQEYTITGYETPVATSSTVTATAKYRYPEMTLNAEFDSSGTFLSNGTYLAETSTPGLFSGQLPNPYPGTPGTITWRLSSPYGPDWLIDHPSATFTVEYTG